MNAVAEETPTEEMMQQLTVVKEKLIPFWGHGRTTMEFAAEPSGDISGKYIYQVPDGELFFREFRIDSSMRRQNTDGSNPLLRYIADSFREFALSLPKHIRMDGPGTKYPKDTEISPRTIDLDWVSVGKDAKISRCHFEANHWQVFDLRDSDSIVQVHLNGVLQTLDVDYTRDGGYIRFIPKIGSGDRISIEELLVGGHV